MTGTLLYGFNLKSVIICNKMLFYVVISVCFCLFFCPTIHCVYMYINYTLPSWRRSQSVLSSEVKSINIEIKYMFVDLLDKRAGPYEDGVLNCYLDNSENETFYPDSYITITVDHFSFFPMLLNIHYNIH